MLKASSQGMGRCAVVMKITQRHIEMARKAGSCRIDYSAGQNVQDISQDKLKWVEDFLHRESVCAAKTIIRTFQKINIIGLPALSDLAFSGAGYGDGDGYGYGCKNCYAETYAHRFWKERKFTDVQCHEDRLDQPLRWKKPRKVFVNSMSDLFHPDVPAEFIGRVFAVMSDCPQHVFQILTKCPDSMLKVFRILGDTVFKEIVGFPSNVWLGVSVEDQKTADERMPILLKTSASVRFVSFEPALGYLNLKKIAVHGGYVNALRGARPAYKPIGWIIMGGESGPNARPMYPDWARKVRDDCQEAGVPFFFKQWGALEPMELAEDKRAAPWRSDTRGHESWSLHEFSKNIQKHSKR